MMVEDLLKNLVNFFSFDTRFVLSLNVLSHAGVFSAVSCVSKDDKKGLLKKQPQEINEKSIT